MAPDGLHKSIKQFQNTVVNCSVKFYGKLKSAHHQSDERRHLDLQ